MAQSLEAALGAAFSGDAPKPAPVEPLPPEEAAPEPPPVQEQRPVGDEPVPEAEQAAEEPPEEAQPSVGDPEYEIEVEGKTELVRGTERVKELLQKGMHYSRNSEAVAREREALAAQKQFMIDAQRFQIEAMKDVARLQALDSQLEPWARVDWAAAFEADALNALKLKEQRDSIREERNTTYNKLRQSADEFQQRQANAAQQLLAAEDQALVAKIPEWRNSERALKEVGEIKSYLLTQGYARKEVEVIPDHRQMILARKAYLYDRLQQGKAEKMGQVRDAPPVVKPGAVAAKTDGKTQFTKFRQGFRRAGRDGNHRAQEESLVEILNRTFK